MHLRRCTYRKSFYDYLLPFIVIFAVAIIIYYILRLLMGGDLPWISQDDKARFKIANGSAEILLNGTDSWHSTYPDMWLNSGDQLKIDYASKAIISFLDNSIIRVNENTDLTIHRLSTGENDRNNELMLTDGELWANIAYTANKNAGTIIKTSNFEVLSRGSILNMRPEKVQVIEGEVEVRVMKEGKIMKRIKVGIGQEVTIDKQVVEDLELDSSLKLLAALDEEFKEGNWYNWNQSLDNDLFLEEEVQSGSGQIGKLVSLRNDEPDINRVVRVTQPKLTNNKTELSKEPFVIKGEVADSVYKVEINNYPLRKYVPGSGKWDYNVSLAYQNLIEGDNEYIIKVYDKSDKVLDTLKIDIYFGEDAEKLEVEEEESIPTVAEGVVASTESTRNDNLKLAVIFPKEGQEYETDRESVRIKGTVAKGTASIEVNDYELKSYIPDAKNWSYNARVSLGNMESGENKYTIVAYDNDGKAIDSVTYTVNYTGEVKEDEEDVDVAPTPITESDKPTETTDTQAEPVVTELEPVADTFTAPVVTSPTLTNGLAETNKSELIFEGTCSPETDKLYINNVGITYQAGSTIWSAKRTLYPGTKIYTILAVSKNNTQKSVDIKVKYTP